MKELGNNFFRRGNLESVVLIYETILDGIVQDIPTRKASSLKYVTVITSCLLNLAACYVKQMKFGKVISICPQVVLFDDRNAKGFYRRAQACTQLGEFEAALTDFEKALDIEPRDKLIRLEIKQLQDKFGNFKKLNACVVSHPPAKESTNGIESLSSSIPLVLPHEAEKKEAQSSFTTTTRQKELKELGGENVTNVSDGSQEGKTRKIEHSMVETSTNCHTENEDESLPDCSSNEIVFGSPFDEKNTQETVKFSKKKNPNSSVHVSRETFTKQLHENVLHYYNPYDMSVMDVRIVQPKDVSISHASSTCSMDQSPCSMCDSTTGTHRPPTKDCSMTTPVNLSSTSVSPTLRCTVY